MQNNANLTLGSVVQSFEESWLNFSCSANGLKQKKIVTSWVRDNNDFFKASDLYEL